jgi:hypothetical protein
LQRQSRRRHHHLQLCGFSKHKTTIGNGAYIGSGSVIAKDVPDDAMAVERSPQSSREDGAAR